MRSVLAYLCCVIAVGCSDSASDQGVLASNAGDAADDATLTDGAGLSDANADDAAPADVTLAISSCTTIGQCVQDECNAAKPLCGVGCGTGATGDTATKANGLLSCITEKCVNQVCAGQIGPACMNPCVGIFCGAEMGACFQVGGDGTSPCSTLFPCFDACDKVGVNVFTCQSKCYNALSANGKAQLATFLACSKSASSSAEALGKCDAELLTCAADGQVGNGDCLALAECGAQCAKGDNTCSGKCFATATSDAQKQYLSIINCLATSAGNVGGCLDPIEACGAPGGTGKCADTLTCISTCQTKLGTKDDGGLCTMQCLHALTKPGADAAIAVLKCAAAKCPGCLTGDANCQACVTSACGGEVIGCAIQ